MALWTPSALVSGISGSLGSVVFGNGPGGRYMRRAPSCVNRRTEAQLVQRTRMERLAEQWLDLSAAQRLAWTTAAAALTSTNALGTPRHLTGRQAFYRFNAMISLCDYGPVEDPPQGQATRTLSSFTPSITHSSTQTCTWYPQTGTGRTRVICFVSRSFSESGIAPYRHRRFLFTYARYVGSLNVATLLANVLGALIEDEYLKFEYLTVTTDQDSGIPAQWPSPWLAEEVQVQPAP